LINKCKTIKKENIMSQQQNYLHKPFSKDKKNEKDSLQVLADKAKKIFLDNSDETVFKDLLNLQESKQLDKVFKLTDQFVAKYAESVSTSQLRNVYNEVVKIQDVGDLKLIRPHLAYVAARQDKNNAREFIAFIDLLIQQVNTKNELESFKKTMEAIVAYHKYYAKN